jgi:hypothetical protein
MTAGCPWLRGIDGTDGAARSVVARPSSGAFRVSGARDTTAVVGSDPRGCADRQYFHELPNRHRALDQRQIDHHGPSEDDPCKVGRALLGLIEVWLDAVEKLQGSGRRGEAVEPSAILNALREVENEDERDAPDSLIYRIAKEDRGHLAALCADPRVMLRRKRQLCPLGRVRELDPSCMRWLDMQPGRSIAEKAGQKQQIRSIVRVQSAATLENCVLRDLILRAGAAADSYCRANARFLRSTRVVAVRRFAQEIRLALEMSAIAGVPALSGVPTPNYVLQTSKKYKGVWKTWLALLRKQQQTQSLLQWGSRWISELAFVGALEALEAWEGANPTLQHRLTWRGEPHHGEFFESAAPIGAYRLTGEARRVRFDVVRSSQLARGVRPAGWERWAQLFPDFAVVAADPDVRPLLVWSIVICDEAQDRGADTLYEALTRSLNAVKADGLMLHFGGSAPSVLRPGLQVAQVHRATDALQIAGETVRQVSHLAGGRR